MTFTAVTPAAFSTPRQDMHDALQAIVDLFITDTSYAIVRKFWHEIPPTLGAEGPFVAIGEVIEEIVHTEGTRITQLTCQLYYVDLITDAQEYARRVNTFADKMRDYLTANARIISRGMLQQTGFAETEVRQGPAQLGAPYATVTYRVMEGRDASV